MLHYSSRIFIGKAAFMGWNEFSKSKKVGLGIQGYIRGVLNYSQGEVVFVSTGAGGFITRRQPNHRLTRHLLRDCRIVSVQLPYHLTANYLNGMTDSLSSWPNVTV
jgi:hypothetical protein